MSSHSWWSKLYESENTLKTEVGIDIIEARRGLMALLGLFFDCFPETILSTKCEAS